MSKEREPVADVKNVDAAKPVTNSTPSDQKTEAPTEANSETVLSVQHNTTPLQQAINEAPPESRASRKARLAQVLNRSIVNDRLNVALPPHLVGEWVRNDPMEINRMQALGFQVDTEYAPNRAIHGGGRAGAIIGDVIFMTTDRENKQMIDEVRHEQFLKLNAPRNAKEEKDYLKVTQDDRDAIPTFSESQTREATRDDIAAALNINRKEE